VRNPRGQQDIGDSAAWPIWVEFPLFGSSFRVVAMYFLVFKLYFEYCRSLYSVLYWYCGVPQYFIFVP